MEEYIKSFNDGWDYIQEKVKSIPNIVFYPILMVIVLIIVYVIINSAANSLSDKEISKNRYIVVESVVGDHPDVLKQIINKSLEDGYISRAEYTNIMKKYESAENMIVIDSIKDLLNKNQKDYKTGNN